MAGYARGLIDLFAGGEFYFERRSILRWSLGRKATYSSYKKKHANELCMLPNMSHPISK
jgi:hypothetical protein